MVHDGKVPYDGAPELVRRLQRAGKRVVVLSNSSTRRRDTLERLDPNPEYWEGKRGACVGTFQQIIARKERKAVLRAVLAMLKSTRNPQVEYLARVMKKWARENGINA